MKLSEQYDEIIGWNEDDGTAHIRNEVVKLEEENDILWDVLRINNLGDIAAMRLSAQEPADD